MSIMQKIVRQEKRNRVSLARNASIAPSTCVSAMSISIALVLAAVTGQANATATGAQQDTLAAALEKARAMERDAIAKVDASKKALTAAQVQTVTAVTQAAQANGSAHGRVVKEHETLEALDNTMDLLIALRKLGMDAEAQAEKAKGSADKALSDAQARELNDAAQVLNEARNRKKNISGDPREA